MLKQRFLFPITPIIFLYNNPYLTEKLKGNMDQHQERVRQQVNKYFDCYDPKKDFLEQEYYHTSGADSFYEDIEFYSAEVLATKVDLHLAIDLYSLQSLDDSQREDFGKMMKGVLTDWTKDSVKTPFDCEDFHKMFLIFNQQGEEFEMDWEKPELISPQDALAIVCQKEYKKYLLRLITIPPMGIIQRAYRLTRMSEVLCQLREQHLPEETCVWLVNRDEPLTFLAENYDMKRNPANLSELVAEMLEGVPWLTQQEQE